MAATLVLGLGQRSAPLLWTCLTPCRGPALSCTRPRHFAAPRGSAAQAAALSAMTAAEDQAIVLDPFAARSFLETGQSPDGGRAFIQFDKDDFVVRANTLYRKLLAEGGDPLQPGYAPFCKHLFVPNFVPGLPDSILPVDDDTASLLKTAYVARTDKELPVLSRWFPKDAVGDRAPEAKYLDLILYSREQIRKENAAMGSEDVSDAPWGIVSIKPQSIDSEIPMEPITMMRNALGVDQGGSGVDLDRDAYAKSVKFWESHARVQ